MRSTFAPTLLLLAAGCASAPRSGPQPPPPQAPPGSPEVHAVRVPYSPVVDGIDNDVAWAEAPEAEIPLKGEGGPFTCRVRAVEFERTIFLLLRWEDPTESRSMAGFHTGPVTEWDRHFMGDAVTVSFPIDGPFTGIRAEMRESSRDVWFWEGTHLDRTGHARDASEKPAVKEEGRWGGIGRILEDGQFQVMCHREDAGRPASEKGPRTGSAADVLARGQWRNGWWTLEFARALTTGHDDDRDFAGLEEIPFDLWVEDRQTGFLGGAVSSPVLRLVLPPPLPDDHQGPFPEPRRAPSERR